MKYAQLLSNLIKKNNTKVWLVNTGWSGGAYGVGERFNLKYTRAIIDAILGNNLSDVQYETDIFGLSFPTSCQGVPSEVLNPVNTWSDKSSFTKTAKKLAVYLKRTLLVMLTKLVKRSLPRLKVLISSNLKLLGCYSVVSACVLTGKL